VLFFFSTRPSVISPKEDVFGRTQEREGTSASNPSHGKQTDKQAFSKSSPSSPPPRGIPALFSGERGVRKVGKPYWERGSLFPPSRGSGRNPLRQSSILFDPLPVACSLGRTLTQKGTLSPGSCGPFCSGPFSVGYQPPRLAHRTLRLQGHRLPSHYPREGIDFTFFWVFLRSLREGVLLDRGPRAPATTTWIEGPR